MPVSFIEISASYLLQLLLPDFSASFRWKKFGKHIKLQLKTISEEKGRLLSQISFRSSRESSFRDNIRSNQSSVKISGIFKHPAAGVTRVFNSL